MFTKLEAVVVIGKRANLLSRVYLNRNGNVNSNNDDLSNSNDNGQMAKPCWDFIMKTYKNLYYKIYKWENLILAYHKARKGKTKRDYVKFFEENLLENLQNLQFELITFTYEPRPQEHFILRDPKTRKISRSDFRDRIIHHAIVNIIGEIFEKGFIFDSCANQKGKGNLFSVNRFKKFQRKITKNLTSSGFCFKADIKQYFQEVNHEVLLKIIRKRIRDKEVIWLIQRIIKNGGGRTIKGMSNTYSRQNIIFATLTTLFCYILQRNI